MSVNPQHAFCVSDTTNSPKKFFKYFTFLKFKLPWLMYLQPVTKLNVIKVSANFTITFRKCWRIFLFPLRSCWFNLSVLITFTRFLILSVATYFYARSTFLILKGGSFASTLNGSRGVELPYRVEPLSKMLRMYEG